MDKVGDCVADRYELLECAGDGGMAMVWRAVTKGAEGFSRPVALKRIHRHLATHDEFVRMFIEEARVGSELHHANIVQLHDFGKDAGGYYLVMEWVDGLHLGQYVGSFKKRGEATPWRLIVACAAGVLAGLESAHTRETSAGELSPVYHRDVTPQNVMVSVQGSAKLGDFGLARAMDRARMTKPDIIKGKLSYLAPEVAFGGEPTVQTDLYSLGIVLWEALSGERLFEGETDAERIMKVRNADVPALGNLRGDLPDELLAILDIALAKEPRQRFRSAHAMQEGLLRLLGSRPVTPAELGRSVREARVASGLAPRASVGVGGPYEAVVIEGEGPKPATATRLDGSEPPIVSIRPAVVIKG